MIAIVGTFKLVSLKFEDYADWIGASWLFRMYPFFFIGSLVKREEFFEKIFDGRNRCFDVMGIAYLVFFGMVMTIFAGRLSLEDAAAPFAIYIIVWLFYKYRLCENKAKKILESFGRQSLAIYLFHYFLLQSIDYSAIAQGLIEHNPLILAMAAILTAFIICLLCLGFSWLVRQNRIFSFLLLGTW